MSYSLFHDAVFGTGQAGLGTVGYRLYNADGTANGSRITTGITERAPGTYAATIAMPTGFMGEIRWDTGGSSPLYATAAINPSDAELIINILASSGAGAYAVTVTVTDTNSVVVQNATVRLVQGINNFVATTNASGVASFSLNAATYNITITAAGYSFAPNTIVVAAAANFPETMAIVTIAAPGGPNQITGYITTRDAQGIVLPHCTITFQLIAAPTPDSYKTFPFIARSDVTGLLQVPLRLSGTYQAQRNGGPWVTVNVPSSGASFQLPQVLGTA